MSGYSGYSVDMQGVERLQCQIDLVSLVVAGLERRAAELAGGYACPVTEGETA